MPTADKPSKNSLSIRLAESAVFLRTNDFTGRSRDSRPALLRGLLVLEIVKPTRISSIDIHLTAKSSTAWPEGVGARRLEVTEEHTVFSASTVFFRAGPTPRRTASIGPGTRDEGVRDAYWEEDLPQSHTPNNEEPEGSDLSRRNTRASRRISADATYFQHSPFSHHEDLRLARTPPYTPTSTSPMLTPLERSVSTLNSPVISAHRPDDSAAQTLEDLRNALRLQPAHDALHHAYSLSPNGSFESPSFRTHRDASRSLSRRPSIEDIPEYEPGPSHQPNSANHISPARSGSVRPSESDDARNEHRGRKHHRFSLASVSSALMDVVRPASPRRQSRDHQREPSSDRHETRRGRSLEKGKEKMVGGRTSKERSSLAKFGEILKLDLDERKGEGHGWKEFKKGTYTYPISFQIPGHSPPTLQCSFGSVVWRLKATAHRPGAFHTKLTTSREVNVISSPDNDDTEDTENIIVERQWDDQLQYFICISGRSFYIGGTVPVQFTLMPLTKLKIYRISVYIEERIDYYTHMRRIARTDPINRVLLLSLKHDRKGAGPILPLVSDDAEAFKNSPLYQVAAEQDDASEMASQLMGPGPWSFHHDLQLPTSCNALRFTNRNRRSNITITHMLKCVMRVERGDDEQMDAKTGKRKLFDIVVQTPVQILSCRCNPDWISLPAYSESSEEWVSGSQRCPCDQHNKPANLPIARVDSSDSSVSTIAASFIDAITPQPPRRLDSLLDQNTLFERLVAGQESEAGEVPPSYDYVARHSTPLLAN
ncbi:hypothetical protein HGRIS_002074 [Hohenbuehelia grisea]|uniref:Arrestin C-terminal-like domain-containing protein n=1 Tax=Hohenbuehelia grisea TaxID=104357 RepID=A0ABR3JK66_9AGAR